MYTPQKLYQYYNAMQFRKLIREGEKLLKAQSNVHVIYIVGLAYDQLALQYTNLKDKKDLQKKAIGYFQSILQKDARSSMAYRGLGLVALHQNRLSLALEYYKKSFAIDQKDPSIFSALGNVYRAQGKYSLAIKWYKRCLTIKTLRATTYSNIAGLYQLWGKSNLSRKYAFQALKRLDQKDDPYSRMFKKHMRGLLD